ncbi:acyl-CoA thioesterase [Rubrivivax gelatinosus]|nr:acyl-CoA thioesterase [Rubrivivax gelatinosus]
MHSPQDRGTTPKPAPVAGTRAAVPALLEPLTLTELVLPGQANHYGTLFGPYGLALLGKAAYLVARCRSGQSVVMAAAGDIEFLRPVPVGALLTLVARIRRVGRSSLTVGVEAWLDAAVAAEPVLRGRFEMVAVDDHGRPAALGAGCSAPATVSAATNTQGDRR